MSWPQIANFNPFDWIVVVVVTLSALLSLWRGFVREALSLAGWVVAFIVANLGAIHVAGVIGDFIANRTGRYVVAWSLLFVATLVASAIAAKLMSKLALAAGVGVLDRLLGSAFGALRGALIVMSLVFVIREVVPKSEQSVLEEAQLMPHIDVMLTWSMRAYQRFRDMDIKIRGLTT